MRRLDRYLLREFLVPLGFCLGGFLIFWIAFDLFSNLHELQNKKLHGLDVAEYYVFQAPEFFILVLPIALLLALLYALTNHSRHNEITAIRAAGVSLWRLCLPYFAVGLAASLGLFLLNEFGVPRTAEIADRILNSRTTPQAAAGERQSIKNLPFRNARADHFWRIGAYDPRTGAMTSPMVEWRLADGSRRQLFAERAEWANGVWTFFRVREFKMTGTNSLPAALPPSPVLPMPEFTETPALINNWVKIEAQYNHRTKTHRADVPIAVIVNYLRLDPNPDKPMRAWLYTKLHGRFAGPFTCLVVVLIAIPFGAGSGRRNVFVGVAASILICFAFFILQQFGFAFGSAGLVPSWLGAWLPNLLFGGVGLFLMARVR